MSIEGKTRKGWSKVAGSPKGPIGNKIGYFLMKHPIGSLIAVIAIIVLGLFFWKTILVVLGFVFLAAALVFSLVALWNTDAPVSTAWKAVFAVGISIVMILAMLNVQTLMGIQADNPDETYVDDFVIPGNWDSSKGYIRVNETDGVIRMVSSDEYGADSATNSLNSPHYIQDGVKIDRIEFHMQYAGSYPSGKGYNRLQVLLWSKNDGESNYARAFDKDNIGSYPILSSEPTFETADFTDFSYTWEDPISGVTDNAKVYLDIVMECDGWGGTYPALVNIDRVSMDIYYTGEVPSADLNGPYNVETGGSVTLDASASSDPDGDITTYRWDFTGNGDYERETTTPTTTVSGVYTDAGAIYHPEVAVVDNEGLSDTATAEVTVNAPEYTLTTETVGQGTIELTPSGGTYNAGVEVTVTASPDDGWHFSNWEVTPSILGYDTAATRVVTMDSDKTVTAYFEENTSNKYVLTIEKAPSDAGAVYGGGEYYEGQTVELGAQTMQDSKYTFDKWTVNGETISTSATYNYEMPGHDVTVTAHFKEQTPTWYYIAGGMGIIIALGAAVVIWRSRS